MRRLKVAGAIVLAGIATMAVASGVLAAQPSNHANTARSYAPASVNMVIVPDSVKGTDKKTHDAYLPATITAHVGEKVTVIVYNLDTAAHSFTSTSLGVNIAMAPAPSDGVPGVTTFSFTATKAGVYPWLCTLPCDNGGTNAWAMTHPGYMAGEVIVLA